MEPLPAASAVLLMGGRSARMGRNKALLRLPNGATLWEHQRRTLESVSPHVMLSVRGVPEFEIGASECVVDEGEEAGPLGGLRAALLAARFPRLVVLAVDMPRMSAEFLSGMLRRSNESAGVLPIVGGMAQPVSAVYPTRILPLVTGQLRARTFGLKALIEAAVRAGMLRKWEVPASDHALFTNWNTPSDVGI